MTEQNVNKKTFDSRQALVRRLTGAWPSLMASDGFLVCHLTLLCYYIEGGLIHLDRAGDVHLGGLCVSVTKVVAQNEVRASLLPMSELS